MSKLRKQEKEFNSIGIFIREIISINKIRKKENHYFQNNVNTNTCKNY